MLFLITKSNTLTSSKFKVSSLLLAFFTVFLLIGCGGGGESSDSDDSKSLIPCTSISSTLPAGSVTLNEKIEGSAPFAVRITDKPIWQFTVNPPDAEGMLKLELKRDDGEIACVNVIRDGNSFTAQIKSGELESGYYDVNASFPGANNWTGSFIVVDGDAMHDVRFGVDAGLSWYRDTDLEASYGPSPELLEQQVESLSLIGFGSVRERIHRTYLYGENGCGAIAFTNKPAPNGKTSTFDVAAKLYDAGIEVVTNLGPPRCGTQPYDMDKIYQFGRLYATHLGTHINSIELSNEPATTSFFDGYPFQYASAMKSFTAGVKSIDPNIRVLTGSYLGAFELTTVVTLWANLFDQEALANNMGASFDTRNEHWYPSHNNPQALITGSNVASKLAVDAAAGIDNKARWLTESGYRLAKTGEHARTEPIQAAFTIEVYAAGFGAGIERIFPFYWQTLLESCPAVATNTDTCEMIWGLTRFEKSDIFRDGRSQILSPRPALSAAAAVIRHLEGKKVLKQEVTADGATVYFEGGTAITWDSSRALSSYGSGVIVKNMYGRIIPNAAGITPDIRNPYLLSNVTEEPGSPTDVITPTVPLANAPAFRVEALGLKINGQEIGARTKFIDPITGERGDDSTIVVTSGDTIALYVRARSQNGQQSIDVTADTAFTCEAGEGLIWDEAASGPVTGGYVCSFKVGQVPKRVETTIGGIKRWVVNGFVKTTGVWHGHTDWVRVGLTGPLN